MAEVLKTCLERCIRQSKRVETIALAAANEAAAAASNDVRWDAFTIVLEDHAEPQKPGTPPWIRFGGQSLEAPLTLLEELGDSPVRLVDARFLVALARKGGILLRRQDLPDAAFVSLHRLKEMRSGGPYGQSLRLVCISYPWLTPDHPDPYGENLRLIARVLEDFIEPGIDPTGSGNSIAGGTLAVFLDFSSLHQKGPDGRRTALEAELFGRALRGLSEWYAHPHTMVFKVTHLPAGYPDGFSFPEGTQPNQAAYFERGWCYCESSLSNLVKASHMVIDLALYNPSEETGVPNLLESVARDCSARRTPPMTPAEFATQLEHKSFTSKKADLATVGQIYCTGFEERMGSATELIYTHLSWGDGEARTLAAVLASAYLVQLQVLSLSENSIGDAGLIALAQSVGSLSHTPLPVLYTLQLDSNSFGDAGVVALSAAIDNGALPALQMLNLEDNEGVTEDGWLAIQSSGAKRKDPRGRRILISSDG